MTKKYCARCGKSIDADAMFCCYCGFDMQDRKLPSPSPQLSPPVPIKLQPQPINPQKTSYYRQEPERITPSISKKTEYANLWSRLIAWILDMIIIMILSAILTFSLGNNLFYNRIIIFLIGWIYFFILEIFNEGQTIGMMALHLKSVHMETLFEAKPESYIIDGITKANIVLLIFDIILGILTRPGDREKRLRFSQRLSKIVVIRSENH